MEFNENLQQMVEEKTKTVVELKNAILSTMAELVDHRDSNTGGHIERTQRYLGILLDALWRNNEYAKEASDWDKDLLLQSAQLHDIGKIAIDDNILRKPGKLTPDEYDIIKQHTEIGVTIVEGIEKKSSHQDFLVQAKTLAATHHEKWDGNGYHKGLAGQDIPLQGRLLAIADVYDALVSDRPYRAAMTHEKAVEIITDDKGVRFDPALIDIFLSVSDEFEKVSMQFKAQYEQEGIVTC
jgi:putative two-component system response regulator